MLSKTPGEASSSHQLLIAIKYSMGGLRLRLVFTSAIIVFPAVHSSSLSQRPLMAEGSILRVISGWHIQLVTWCFKWS